MGGILGYGAEKPGMLNVKLKERSDLICTSGGLQVCGSGGTQG